MENLIRDCGEYKIVPAFIEIPDVDKTKRVILIVDGPNIYFAQKKLNWKIDPYLLKSFVEDRIGQTSHSIYYLPEDKDNGSKNNFIDILEHMDYNVFVKPLPKDSNGNIRGSVSMDCEIIHDLFDKKEDYDTIVLVSGSRVFIRTLETLKSKYNKHFYVISTDGFAGKDFQHFTGSHFLDLEDIKIHIEREQTHNKHTANVSFEDDNNEEIAEKLKRPERKEEIFTPQPDSLDIEFDIDIEQEEQKVVEVPQFDSKINELLESMQ